MFVEIFLNLVHISFVLTCKAVVLALIFFFLLHFNNQTMLISDSLQRQMFNTDEDFCIHCVD